jgi:hypothetical protein
MKGLPRFENGSRASAQPRLTTLTRPTLLQIRQNKTHPSDPGSSDRHVGGQRTLALRHAEGRKAPASDAAAYARASRAVRPAHAVRRVPVNRLLNMLFAAERAGHHPMPHSAPQAPADVLESGWTHRQILCRVSRHLTPMPHSLLHISHVDMLMLCAS